MAKTKRSRSRLISGKGTNKALLLGGGLLGLYLITRPIASGDTGAGGSGGTGIPAWVPFAVPGPGSSETKKETTIFREFTKEFVANPIEQIVTGVARGVTDIPKDIAEASEERTSEEVFRGETKKDVSTFLAPRGTRFTNVTYPEFIEQQPLVFRAAATTGNLITGQGAAKYGAYVAEETKKGQAIAGVDPEAFAQRFASKPAWQQTLIGLGQAATVPFGGGGAAGWGAQIRSKWPQWGLG